jgi:hypothetical protein
LTIGLSGIAAETVVMALQKCWITKLNTVRLATIFLQGIIEGAAVISVGNELGLAEGDGVRGSRVGDRDVGKAEGTVLGIFVGDGDGNVVGGFGCLFVHRLPETTNRPLPDNTSCGARLVESEEITNDAECAVSDIST